MVRRRFGDVEKGRFDRRLRQGRAADAFCLSPATLPKVGSVYDVGLACAVLNAANEVAVAAFLDGAIRFDQIHSVNAGTLERVIPSAGAAGSVESLLALDAEARRAAEQLLTTSR